MDNQNQYGKSKFVTASMLLGILSAVLLTVSLFVPAIDLSAYHAQVQIRYSIMKICENVGLISDMWRGIPIGILIAAVGMLVLSFVRIPPLKAIPCMIVVCMIIIALVDMGNVTAWISKMLARFISSQVSSGSSVSGATIWKSFQAGIYLLAAGLVSGIAVASAASAALGAISEDSSVLGKSLIFVGLAEGVCLYGLIISFMILGNL